MVIYYGHIAQIRNRKKKCNMKRNTAEKVVIKKLFYNISIDISG